MISEKDELGDDLCKYCPLEKHLQGSYSTPGGMSAGCEGRSCDEAYENYLLILKGEQKI